MKRNLWIGVAVLWLAVPFAVLRYWMVWDRLQQRIATHFNAAGQPNGWMTPMGSLLFAGVALAIIAAIATVAVAFIRKVDRTAWAVLGIFYMLAGVFVWANESILAYNLHGQPIRAEALVVLLVAGAIALTTVFLNSGRGAALPYATVVAEEVHASPMWAAVLGALAVVEGSALLLVPIPAARIGLGAGAAVLILAVALAWDGFHYRFTTTGVEIRTLGWRLRSIPLEQIKEYAVAPWRAICGYGIRGVGSRRAYVWGNRGVRIRTSDGGDIFLGHNQPERIMRDLDAIRQFAR